MLQALSRSLRVPSLLQQSSFAFSKWATLKANEIAQGQYRLSYLYGFNAGEIVAKDGALVTAPLNPQKPGSTIKIKKVGSTSGSEFALFLLQDIASQKWIQASDDGNKFVDEAHATKFTIIGHVDLKFFEVNAYTGKNIGKTFGVSDSPQFGQKLKLVNSIEAFQFLKV